MPINLEEAEDDTRRQTYREPDGIAYVRVYNVDPRDAVDLPEPGDPMPGYPPAGGDAALLGPFIERNGVRFGKQAEGGEQQVTIKSKLLATYADATDTALEELAGRSVGDTDGGWLYYARFVGTAYTDLPMIGDMFSDLSLSKPVNHTSDPVCIQVSPKNATTYPGRWFASAVFAAARRRSEIGTY